MTSILYVLIRSGFCLLCEIHVFPKSSEILNSLQKIKLNLGLLFALCVRNKVAINVTTLLFPINSNKKNNSTYIGVNNL